MITITKLVKTKPSVYVAHYFTGFGPFGRQKAIQFFIDWFYPPISCFRDLDTGKVLNSKLTEKLEDRIILQNFLEKEYKANNESEKS